MNKQLSMSFVQDELADVKTNKTALLEQMNRLVPWGEQDKKSTDGVWLYETLFMRCFFRKHRIKNL